MARPPSLPAEQKATLVLAVLAGEMSAAQAARTAGVSGQAISNWKRRFVEAGRGGLESDGGQQSSNEVQLLNEISELKRALGDSFMQLRAIRSAIQNRPTTRGPIVHGNRLSRPLPMPMRSA
jgi:transposase